MPSDTGIVGKNAYIAFGGTVLSTNYRTLNSDASIGTVDQTAGADDGMMRLTTLTDSNFSLDIKRPSGAAGTATWVGLAPGAEGTFEFGPAGTATGNVKATVNAILDGRTNPITYNDLVIDSMNFVQNDNNGVQYTTY